MTARAQEVLTQLNRIAGEVEAPYPHWLGSPADQGPSYCFDCASARVSAGEANFVDGGWPQDNDGCCHCEDCGRLLDYTLTEYGVESELEHFRGTRFRRAINPELAYHLARLLEHHDDQPQVLKLLPRVRRALSRMDLQS
ncbi:hypothetical protein [uncultured Arenimonas sp.]|uniref:hypothetical protein n=1 Tax=uncultured Arenimonas sp. TaxID=546226 RepID=UPI0030DBDE07